MSRTVNVIALVVVAAWVFAEWRYGLPGWTLAVLLLTYLVVTAYGTSVLAMGYYLPVRWKGKRGSRSVALTFDDGPVVNDTERILDILQEHGVPAAFFCIGNRVETNPQLVQRMNAAGHLIGNHSYWHRTTFDLQSPRRIYDELVATDHVIEKAIGNRPAYFRPPYGVTNPMVAAAVRRGKYLTVGWSIRSFDTVIKNREKLFRRITRSIKGGDIILLHDHGACTAAILPDLIRHIQSLGLKIVRLDEMIDERAYVAV